MLATLVGTYLYSFKYSVLEARECTVPLYLVHRLHTFYFQRPGNDWDVLAQNFALVNLSVPSSRGDVGACMHDIKPVFK